MRTRQTDIAERIMRQVRRLMFAAFCAILAVALLSDNLLAPLLAGLATLSLGVLLLMVQPGWRRLLEVLGLGALIAAALPAPLALFPGLMLLFSALAHVILYGRWSDHPAFRLRLETRRQVQVKDSAAVVWHHIVPGSAHPDDHWTGTLIDFDADEDDPDTLYLRYRTDDGLFDEATVTFLQKDKPRFCRYLLERNRKPGTEEAEVTHRITEYEDGCDIETTTIQEGLPPRIAIARWFDDSDSDLGEAGLDLIENRRHYSVPAMARIRARRSLPVDG